ncbi:MAG: VOC family protein [Steroidobacteraceae bacterium]|jgi:catechol 2,3-dioxygenase-like lactoylglutathione lyase family enzyme
MLSAILAVTLVVPDLPTAERAYNEWLGYRTVASGTLDAAQAAGWQAPRTEGRRYALLQPASGATTYLRLVQSPATPGYAPMLTHGWNSNEILVEDPVALAAKFGTDAPFKVIGVPRPLTMSPSVIAMQALGPAGELNYFTRIPPEGTGFLKASAKSFVDRTFIVVLGGPSMDAMIAFYRDRLGLVVTPPAPAKVNVLQQAWGVGAEATVPLAIAKVSDRFLIELDGYDAHTTPRPQREGDLPPGLAMVSFETDDLDARALDWLVAPRRRDDAPYSGRRAGLLRGAAGELVELVETSRKDK